VLRFIAPRMKIPSIDMTEAHAREAFESAKKNGTAATAEKEAMRAQTISIRVTNEKDLSRAFARDELTTLLLETELEGDTVLGGFAAGVDSCGGRKGSLVLTATIDQPLYDEKNARISDEKNARNSVKMRLCTAGIEEIHACVILPLSSPYL
jgi:hypothetical protein